MARIYTEIRLEHESLEDKNNFEAELDQAIKKLGYSKRSEWLRAMKREMVKKASEM